MISTTEFSVEKQYFLYMNDKNLHIKLNNNKIMNREVPVNRIVISYTGTNWDLKKSFIENMSNLDCHLFVGRTGDVYQLRSLDEIRYKTEKGDITICLLNPGKVSIKGNRFISSLGYECTTYLLHKFKDEYWEKYTDVQIMMTKKICAEIVKNFYIESIIGLKNKNKKRRDPGPAFPLKELQNLCN